MIVTDVRPRFLHLAKKKFRDKTQIEAKVYLERHRGRKSHRRREASWAARTQETCYRGKRRELRI